MYHQMIKLIARTSSCQLLTTLDLVYLSQNIVLGLGEQKNIMKEEYEKWVEVQVLLVNELASRRSNYDSFFSAGKNKSKAEMRVNKAVNKLFKNTSSSILVSRNEYLFNLFESDIVLRTVLENSDSNSDSSSNNDIIINIELDGLQHQREKSKRFGMLRDKYLKSQGVVVERLENSSLEKMSEDQLEKWLLKILADVRTSYIEIPIIKNIDT